MKKENGTLVFALGGLCEVGKNMYCVMHDNEIIIVDAGVIFPESDIKGVDYVIPDYTFLKQNESKIKALFITHGHEDHIGGITSLLQTVDIPYIYAPNQACGLIRKKIAEKSINFKNLIVYTEKTVVKTKHFSVEFFITTHSIPDSHGICIHTPDGTVVATGDFKFDLTPIGPMANLHKMASIGKKGVTLLLSDSTNAMNEGMSRSESKVDEALSEIFDRTNGRIIIATFASNIYRLKHIVDTCYKRGRKIAIFGRSMENNIEISIEGGYIKHKDIFITPEEANKLPNHKVCLLCTGSQGEPLAALTRIADGCHKQIKLQEDDVVIFSSSTIPGNALSVSRTINKLYLKGVEVYTNTSLNDIHTTGHGSEEELKLMIRLMMPRYFMPVHGEYRMLKRHAEIAQDCGLNPENTFVLNNGDVLVLNKGKIKQEGSVVANDIYVDGNRLGDVSNAVMRDRRSMSNDGIVIIVATLSNDKLLTKPNITTRGFVTVNESEAFLSKLDKVSTNVILKSIKKNRNDLKADMITGISTYIKSETGRNPIILPIITEVEKKETITN